MAEDIIGAIIGRIGDPVHVVYPEHKFYCVFCPDVVGKVDDKGTLYVNPESGYFCHRCLSRGPIAKLITVLKIEQDEMETIVLDSMQLRHTLTTMTIDRQEDPAAPPPEVKLPDNTEAVWAVPGVLAYAYSRGLTIDDCKYYGLLAWTDPKGMERLLFPDTQDGKIVFWTARAVRGGAHRKYWSAFDAKKSKCVWNIDRLRAERPIYIAEGILSAMACGSNGVALYGKYLSDFQCRLIGSRAGSEGVRIVLDQDALRYVFKAVEAFHKIGIPAGAAVLPSGDPDDMKQEELAEILLKSRPLSDGGLLRMRAKYA